MIEKNQIENILQKPESSTLDFKRQLYDFANNPEAANAALVKDVCAMINTIRTQSSYIIFGVDANPGFPNVVVGLSSAVDEGIFQDKVKTKISPNPEFSYNTISINNKLIGVMEFPLRRYESPVAPTINMRGVKSGTIYFRQGSTNTEASGHEVIRIYEWIKSLPAAHNIQNKHDELIGLLIQLQHMDLPLAPILPKMLTIGKKYQIQSIVEFANFELKGVEGTQLENAEPFKYRLQKVFIDFGASVQINNVGFTASQIRDAIRKEEHFIESDLHMGKSVQEMETMIADMTDNNNMRFAVLDSNSKTIMPWYKGNDTRLRVYLFSEDLTNTIRRIRQKAIDLVMDSLE
jgi:hypothetical protein